MKTVKKITTLFSILFLTGMAGAQTNELPTFSEVSARGTLTVTLKDGEVPSIHVEGGDKGNILTEVRGNTLHLSNTGNADDAAVIVTSPMLKKVSADGSVAVKSEGNLHTAQLTLEALGASSIIIGLESGELHVYAAGSGSVHVSGRTTRLHLDLADASSFAGKNLEVVSADVTLNGASSASLSVRDTIKGSVNDVASLNIRNEPASIQVESSEAGNFSAPNTGTATSDTTKLKIGEKRVIIYDEIDSTQDTTGDKPKKRVDNVHWAGLDLSFGGFLNPSQGTAMPAGYDFLELDYGRSFTVNLNIIEKDLRLVKNYVKLVTGLGFEWNSYRFDQNTRLIPNSNPVAGYIDSAHVYKKSKQKASWINAPLLLQFNTGNDPDKSFHIAVGGIFGYNYGSHLKLKYRNSDGAEMKEKIRDDFQLNPFKYAATVRLGYGDFTLFATYNLVPMFKGGRGPELYPFTAGLTLIGF